MTSRPPLVDVARDLYRQRRIRTNFFPGSLFAEPTWDMLLDLFIAVSMGRKITVKSVCLAANVPATTALRHLRWLEEQGLVNRLSHPRDGRATHVQLSSDGWIAMNAYLEAIAPSS
jgi:DNA-binding transcriptional ArsR family regulator